MHDSTSTSPPRPAAVGRPVAIGSLERPDDPHALKRIGGSVAPAVPAGASSVRQAESQHLPFSRTGNGGRRAAACGGPAAEPGGEAVPGTASILIHEHKSPRACQAKTYDHLQRLDERLGRFTKAKRQAAAMWDFLITEAVEPHGAKPAALRGVELQRCGSWLDFQHFFTTGQIRLSAAKFCQQPRLCGMCAIRRAVKLTRAYVPKILTALQPRECVPSMVTLTIRNRDDLGEAWLHLNRSVTLLMRRASEAARGGRCAGSSLASVRGAVASFEFKRGSGGGGWHPHVHMVVLADSEISEASLSSEWRQITGDSHVVDVRPLRSARHFVDEGLTEMQLVEAMGDDLLEVFKYPLKFGDLVPADRWAAFGLLMGRRLIRSWGNLRGVEPDPSYLDEPLDEADLPWVPMSFRFVGDFYRQVFADRRQSVIIEADGDQQEN